jgi:predicted enzyme related to lactoylglutathione lyase
MSRLQLALNVSDLDNAVAFYSKLFATEPAKLRPGYANFAIAEPPLKLVLIEGGGQPGSLNHLGVEVDSRDAVAANTRLTDDGLAAATEDEVTCCYACRTRSGSMRPTESRGRSTRSSPTPRCPPVSSEAWPCPPTRFAAEPPPSQPPAAAEPWQRRGSPAA